MATSNTKKQKHPPLEYFSIKIRGQQFKKSYLVYVIDVKAPNGSYHYAGQTGDRKYTTARPAFRRLAGHLNDQGHATDNRLYRQIARQILEQEVLPKQSFSDELKRGVSDFLCNCELEMHVFVVEDFKDDVTEDEHQVKRKFVESIEINLIHEMIKAFGRNRVLNHKINPLVKTIDNSRDYWVNQILSKIQKTIKN